MEPVHLQMIQAAITRLATNSYAYKGWAVTITAALVAFLIGKNTGALIAGLYPILAFWGLDAYNLSLERAFRRLYDAAREDGVPVYSMNIAPFRKPFADQVAAMLSTSMLLFYVSAIVCVCVIAGVARTAK